MRLFLISFASVLVLATGSLPALAQSKAPESTAPSNKAAPKQAKKKWLGPRLTPKEQLELLLQMSPEDREDFLSQLPPVQREQREKQLENLDSLNPQQRAKRLKRLEILNNLPAARKLAVREEINRITAMTFVQRRARLHSKDFEQSYSPGEMELIRGTFPNAAK